MNVPIDEWLIMALSVQKVLGGVYCGCLLGFRLRDESLFLSCLDLGVCVEIHASP